jgi:hypothetical protein
MFRWISDLLFGPPYRRSGTEAARPAAHLEQSVAWSSFLASGVDGVEDVTFSEFVQRQDQRGKSAQ